MKSETFCRNLAFTIAMISLLCFSGIAGATEKTATVEGVVTKIDRDSKTVGIKTADGTERTIHLVKRTVVRGQREFYKGYDEAMEGLHQADQVVVHYTKQGTEDTAEEFDQIGRDGLKASEGTITKFDRSAQTMTIKVVDGTEENYRLTERAAEDAGIETEDAAKKSAHAIVYYTEEAGQKVAHFFKTN